MASTFLSNTASLRVQGSVSLNPVRGNACRKRKQINEEEVIATTKPLPKRRKITPKNN